MRFEPEASQKTTGQSTHSLNRAKSTSFGLECEMNLRGETADGCSQTEARLGGWASLMIYVMWSSVKHAQQEISCAHDYRTEYLLLARDEPDQIRGTPVQQALIARKGLKGHTRIVSQ